MADPEMGRPQERTGIERLPTEILLNVAKNLECARDLSSLGRTSKTMRHVADGSFAWHDFGRSKFPFTSIPPTTAHHDWKAIAESMTYQSRCWDRRSIRFTAMYPRAQPQRQGLAFQPVIDVDYDMDAGREMVVWGAGEDIVARYRQRGRGERQQHPVSWHQSLGAQNGLRGGVDDISTIHVVKQPHLKAPAILVGRENGDLSLRSAQPDSTFGQQLASFGPATRGPDGIALRGQQQIMSADVLSDNNEGLVAACSDLGIAIYELPKDNNATTVRPVMPPISVWDGLPQSFQQPANAKWMGSSDLIALAMRGMRHPLRYMAVTPTGWTTEGAAKNARVEDEFLLAPSSLFANSLQPIRRYPGATGRTPLLLSSWKDGSVRLQDIRTPSPFDVVYQDNVQPWCELGTLLPYGADRFIGGDMQSSMIKIFDFRWPKQYYHTTGLQCGPQFPYRFVEQRFVSSPSDTTNGRACCDHVRGEPCRWHHLSRDIYHRPNALCMFSQSLPSSFRGARVNSLAKASDLSPNFYIGVTGGVIEANLGGINNPEQIDPHLSFPDYRAPNPRPGSDSGPGSASQPPPPPSSTTTPSSTTAVSPPYCPPYLSRPVRATMMEVGDGLRDVSNTANIRMPMVHSRVGGPDRREQYVLDGVDAVLRKKHRLDERFHKIEDFSQDLEGVGRLMVPPEPRRFLGLD